MDPPDPPIPQRLLRLTRLQEDESSEWLNHSSTKSGQAHSVLYSFGEYQDDSESPDSTLIRARSVLYGTSVQGGASNDGTVFSITPLGNETVLHTFPTGSGDGEVPWTAGLVTVAGTLYGTTAGGGEYGGGTVFSITSSGKEAVLYSFGGSSGDGAAPRAGLTEMKGKLYGTTSTGGADDEGTVFSITTSGTETVVHSFGGSGDGRSPLAGLINVKDELYGTTSAGGNGAGTVFTVTASGKETVLHRFGSSGPDGDYPLAGLLNVRGTLYGTTALGGIKDNGAVFSITTSGKETLLHSFKDGSRDGSYPTASLTDVADTLYGTTFEGGSRGDGTIFAVTRSGKETVLHSFDGGYTYSGDGDGASPQASSPAATNVSWMLFCGAFRMIRSYIVRSPLLWRRT